MKGPVVLPKLSRFWNSPGRLPLLILLGLPALVYLPSLGNGFVWDDHGVVGTHAWVQDLRHIPFLFSPDYWNQYFPGIKGQYRPLRSVTFALQYAVWGLNPVPYHAFNVLFHLVNVWLVYRLLLRLLGSRGPAWLGALLFALHPLHTEVVVWIKNRTEILALLFSLLSLEAYFRAQGARGPWRRVGWVAASTLSCTLAILSKEVALSLPLVMLAHALLLSPRTRTALACGLASLVPMGLYFANRFLFLQAGTDPPPPPLSLDVHALLILRTLGTYLALLVAPLTLNADRPLDIRVVTAGWETWACGVGVLLALALGVFLLLRRQFLPLFALLWLLIGLLPASNIQFLYTRPLADQRVYFPSVGFCLLLSMAMTRMRERFPIRRWENAGGAGVMAATVILLGLYSIQILTRVDDWRDDMSLIRHTLVHSPDSARPHFQMALLLHKRGDLDGAAREFQRTIELSPALADPHNYLGVIYSEKRDYERAVRSFSKALQLKPDFSQALANMAIPLVELGRDKDADRALQRAVELAPREPLALTHLGIIKGRMGLFAEAVDALGKALEVEPGNVKARVHRAYAYAEMGDLDGCIKDLKQAALWAPDSVGIRVDLATAFRKKGERDLARKTLEDALSLDPADPNAQTAMGNLLAGLKDYEKAVPYFEEAVRLSPNQALPYYNLGRVLQDARRLDEAAIPLRQAVEIEPRNPKFLSALAALLRETGKTEEAGDLEERARGSGGEDPRSSPGAAGR